MKSRAWDSTTRNLSDLTYSPQERRLKKEVLLKATKAHRSTACIKNEKRDFIKEKKVNWKEWNLREDVDFESELETFIPVNEIGSLPVANSLAKRTAKSSHSCPNTDAPPPVNTGNLDKAQKDAIRHLKNVLNNAVSESVPLPEIHQNLETHENLELNADTSALFIQFILNSKNKDQERDKEISDLKDQVSKLKTILDETRDDLDACQLIVSNHQKRIQDLQGLVDYQDQTIKDQANLLINHMSSKKVLESIQLSMSGLRL